jgi:PEP-CTERM motif
MRKFIASALLGAALAAGFTGIASAAIGVREADPRFIVINVQPPPSSVVKPPPVAVPEPGTLSLLGLGVLSVGLFKRRR